MKPAKAVAAKKATKKHTNYKMYIKRLGKEVRTPNMKKETVSIVSTAFEACVDNILSSLEAVMTGNKNITCKHINLAMIGCSDKNGLSKKTLESAIKFTNDSLERIK